jgi:hypothetical protein
VRFFYPDSRIQRDPDGTKTRAHQAGSFATYAKLLAGGQGSRAGPSLGRCSGRTRCTMRSSNFQFSVVHCMHVSRIGMDEITEEFE